MKVKHGDFVIAMFNDKKYLLKVASQEGEAIVGSLASSSDSTVEPISFFENDVIANLGKKPALGQAYGVRVEPFEEKVTTAIGALNIFCKLQPEVLKAVTKAFKKADKVLVGYGLTNLYFDLELELRYEKGSTAGMYKANKNRAVPDTLTLYAKMLDDDIAGTIFHEYAHGMWHRMISKESTKTKWIEAYSKGIEAENFKDSALKTHLNQLLNSDSTFSDYIRGIKREADDIDNLIAKFLKEFFRKVRRLSDDDLDNLALNNKEALKELWPTKISPIGRVKAVGISDYGMTNVKEFFAEAFRFHASGAKLPKSIRKLMEKTIVECSSYTH